MNQEYVPVLMNYGDHDDAHGGMIRVHSQKGVGTEVIIDVPVKRISKVAR